MGYAREIREGEIETVGPGDEAEKLRQLISSYVISRKKNSARGASVIIGASHWNNLP